MNVVVWGENIHEKKNPLVTEIYPGGIHGYVASFLESEDVHVRVATLDMPECGLPQELLEETDVLVWWGHVGHRFVPDELVDRIQKRVLEGMGLVALHSSHLSKIFKRLMGTPCTLKWRGGARERIWTIKPNHPIAEGVPETFALEQEEMYGEPFTIPEPQEVLFIGWFNGGEVFRSGCTWVRGNGRVFYFQPGHETNPSLKNPHVQRIIQNGVKWCCPLNRKIEIVCPEAQPLEQG